MVRGGQVIAKHGRTGRFLSHFTSFFFNLQYTRGTNRYRLQITFLLHTNQPIVDPEQNVTTQKTVHIFDLQ